MRPPLGRETLLATAADCAYPAVHLGRLTIEGEAGWRDALTGTPAATPGERLTLLRMLGAGPLLAATPHGRARLATNPALGRDLPTDPDELHDRIRTGLAYFGDGGEMLNVVVAGLASCPPPVVAVVLLEAAILGVGWNSWGWHGAGPGALLAPDTKPRVRTVCLTGLDVETGRLARTCRHEFYHCFTEPPPHVTVPAVAIPAFRAVAIETTSAELAAHDAERTRRERLADAAALAWEPLG